MWGWVDKLKSFWNRITNKVFGAGAVRELGSANLDSVQARVESLAGALAAGGISLGEWQSQMRQALKDAHIQMYVLGVGGTGQLTQQDYGRIGGILQEQFRYLDGFAAEIARGGLTAAQIRARAAMYAQAAREAYERGKARAWNVVGALPAYPGDGNSACLVNCKCYWEFEETKAGVNAYWRLGAAEHCTDCVQNSQTWAPFLVPGEAAP